MVFGRDCSRLRGTCWVVVDGRGSEIGIVVSVDDSLEAPVRFFKEKDAGKMENRLGFSCFGTSLLLRRSLFFRPNPKDDDLRDSIDWRGLSDTIGLFMLVGGYRFSCAGLDCSCEECVCDFVPKKDPDLPKTLTNVLERLWPRPESRCALIDEVLLFFCVLGRPADCSAE
jgi:hypothetical protein